MCQRRQSQNLTPAKRPHTNLDENLSQKPQGLNWMISFCALGHSGLGTVPLEPVWYGFAPSSFLKTVWYSFPPSAIRGPADLQAFAPLHRCTIGPSGPRAPWRAFGTVLRLRALARSSPRALGTWQESRTSFQPVLRHYWIP